MVADVFLKIGEAKQQFEELLSLRWVGLLRFADQSLRYEPGVREKPFELLRVNGLVLLALLECLQCTGRGYFQEVIHAQQVRRPEMNCLVGTAGDPTQAQSWAGHLTPTLGLISKTRGSKRWAIPPLLEFVRPEAFRFSRDFFAIGDGGCVGRNLPAWEVKRPGLQANALAAAVGDK